jgi:hypothetical protein
VERLGTPPQGLVVNAIEQKLQFLNETGSLLGVEPILRVRLKR